MTTPTDPVQRPPPGTRRSRCRSAIAPALEKADGRHPPLFNHTVKCSHCDKSAMMGGWSTRHDATQPSPQ